MNSFSEALSKNCHLQYLSLRHSCFSDSTNVLADELKRNQSITSLKLDHCVGSKYNLLELIRAINLSKIMVLSLNGHIGNESFCQDVLKLLERNGRLIVVYHTFEPFFDSFLTRNEQMHKSALAVVIQILCLRNSQKKSFLHLLPKEIVRLITLNVWESRVEIETWSV